MCEKIGNGFKWELEYFGFKIYLCENSLLTMSKTLNVNSPPLGKLWGFEKGQLFLMLPTH